MFTRVARLELLLADVARIELWQRFWRSCFAAPSSSITLVLAKPYALCAELLPHCPLEVFAALLALLNHVPQT